MLTPAFSSSRGLDLLWAVIDQWAAPCIVRSDRRTWSWDVILAALYLLIDLDISGVSMLSFEHPGRGERNEEPGSALRPDAQRRKANCINRTTAATWCLCAAARWNGVVLYPSTVSHCRCLVSRTNSPPELFSLFPLCSLSLPNSTYLSWWQHSVIITPGTSIKQLDVWLRKEITMLLTFNRTLLAAWDARKNL